MSQPRVVHCKREKYDVYIGRDAGTLMGQGWGNPFRLGQYSREECIRRYREWLSSQPELIERAKRELRGKVLGCWCAPQACHGDVLLEVANEAARSEETKA